MATAKKAPAKKAASATTAAPAKKAAPTKKKAAAAAPEVVAPSVAATTVPAKKPAAKKAAAKKTAPVATAAPAATSTGKANSAFMKALTPSAALAAVVGANPLPRTQVVKQVWAYIKEHKLQDEVNKRLVNTDAKLREVFGKVQVTMFEIAGLIGKHLK